jgi:hypothetical protein
MPLTKYKIWSIGHKVGSTATAPIHVGVSGIAKTSLPGMPHVVINEMIANKLAKSILLNTPDGFIIDKDSKPHYVSMNFNLAGHDLPPADALAIVTTKPELSIGIVLFDAWILNRDRHFANIFFDSSTGVIQIFDHSHSLFGDGDIKLHLETNRNNPYLGDHCLLPHITSLTGIEEWLKRIASVPEFYIREVIDDTVSIGLDSSLVTFCVDFMLERRQRLLDILKDHRSIFPKVVPTTWDAL